MLAWILDYVGYSPSYLIGGVPANLPSSSRLTSSGFFVIEADEYDTAFFDKRSKFIHYAPKTLVINNLEFDHADIFPDLKAIQRQFHHLIRTVPSVGKVIYPANNPAINDLLAMGCWSEREALAGDNGWRIVPRCHAGSQFDILRDHQLVGSVVWSQLGDHNMSNALAALVAAHHVGVLPGDACAALCEFQGVKRRMELLADFGGVRVYDDFAHHPTAIQTTLQGLRAKVGNEPVLALLEPRSNTMRRGVFRAELGTAVADAQKSYWLQPAGLEWNLTDALQGQNAFIASTVDALLQQLMQDLAALTKAHVVVMSNGSFDGIHGTLVERLGAVRSNR